MFNRLKLLRGGSCLFCATSTFVNTNCSGISLKPYTETSQKHSDKVYDVAVIGAGVVGLAVARELAVTYGASVAIIEKEDTVAAGASSGNSGLGCTGYDAPVGSLERKLLRRSIQIHQNLYRSFGLSHEHVRKSGSLVVAWTQEELEKLPEVLNDNIKAGDQDVRLLSRKELLELEPTLSPLALGAVLCPNEAIVEPWLVPIGYAEACRQAGVNIQTGKLVIRCDFDNEKRYWSVHCKPCSDASVGRSYPPNILAPVNSQASVRTTTVTNSRRRCLENVEGDSGTCVNARVVVNCAGLFGDEIEKMRRNSIKGVDCNAPANSQHSLGIANQSDIVITPRKGQFVVFKPACESSSPQFIIEPVATEYTKGVIVWNTVYGNIVVGPTAVDTFDKEDRSTDKDTIERLIRFGRKVIPSLVNAEVIGTYSGLRPASQYRDYQIHTPGGINGKRHQSWITVAGIRSTGLTASSGIAEYVGHLYCLICGMGRELPKLESYHHGGGLNHPCDDTEYSVAPDGLAGVTEAAKHPEVRSQIYKLPNLPSLVELAGIYECTAATCDRRNDSMLSTNANAGVLVINGTRYRVTHPISTFGLETLRAKYVREGAVCNED